MNHDELLGLVAIHALGALETHDEGELEGHLEDCRECAEALRADLELAAHLALTCEPVPPGAGLRRSVLAAVREIPQAVPLVSPRRHRLGRHRHAESIRMLRSQQRFVGGLEFPIRTVVPLVAAAGPGRTKKAVGRIYVSSDERSGGLVATGMADPGPRVYQLWLLRGGRPTPMQAFRPDARGLALVPITADLLRGGAFAVTLEAQAGLGAPQGSMVLTSV